MRGGCLRFQAQYLRRIRLPHWKNVPPEARKILSRKNGGTTSDMILQAVAAAYGLTADEQTHLQNHHLLCRKMVHEQLYTAATSLASPRAAIRDGHFTDHDDMTSLGSFVTTFAGHIAAAAARKNKP